MAELPFECELLAAISARIDKTRSLIADYPRTIGETEFIIDEYIDYRRKIQADHDTLVYLHDFYDLIAADLETQAQAEAEEEQQITAINQEKATQGEIKKIVKKLDKSDLISPETAKALLKLSNLRRDL